MPNFYRRNSWRSAAYTNQQEAGPATPKIMTARYPGRCLDCGGAIAVGDVIRYASGQVRHASQDACRAQDAQRAALAATLCSNGGEANILAASAGSAFRGAWEPTPRVDGFPAAQIDPAIVAERRQQALDLGAIRAFIQAAKDRGLKAPKLRVLDADGRAELTLGLTVVGHNPGSVSVKRNGSYIGLIRQDGGTRGAITPELAAHLQAVAADPAAAAKRYAVLMCRCSFCGLALTDAGSVEVGYGPVCAKHWGLPHAPKGTPAVAAPVPACADCGRELSPAVAASLPVDVWTGLPATKRTICRGCWQADRTSPPSVEADERAMQAMEAAADRAQTIRETAHTMTEVA